MHKIWKDLKVWLRANQPVLCSRCLHFTRRKHAVERFHRTGGRVRLCELCDTQLYRPFSGGRRGR